MRLVGIEEAARAVGVRPQDIRAAIRTGALVQRTILGKPYVGGGELAEWRLARGAADSAPAGPCPEADVRRALFLLGDSATRSGDLAFAKCPVHRAERSLVLDPRGRIVCHFGCTPSAVLAALEPKPAPVRPQPAGQARERRRARPFHAKKRP